MPLKRFVRTLKSINIKFLYVVLLDGAFFVFSYLCLLVWGKLVERRTKYMVPVVGDINPLTLTIDEFHRISSIITLKFIFVFLAYVALLLVAIFLIYAVTRFLIYSIITEEKIKLHKFPRFFLASAVWLFSFLVASTILIIITRTAAVFFVLIVLLAAFVHLTTALYMFSIKEKDYKQILKKVYHLGIRKIKHFVVPYLLLIALFAVVAIISSVFFMTSIYIKTIPVNIISSVFVLSYLAFFRFYIVRMMRSFK